MLLIRRLIRVYDFQTCISAAGQVSLEMEQLISHMTTAVVDVRTCFQNSDMEVIPASEVHDLHYKIHDILHNAASKRVGNTACISTFLFYFASRQHCEVWVLQFPFFSSIKDNDPLRKACFYVCISCNVAQVEQCPSSGLSQSLTSVQGSKASVQKWPALDSGGTSLVKKCHFDT